MQLAKMPDNKYPENNTIRKARYYQKLAILRHNPAAVFPVAIYARGGL